MPTVKLSGFVQQFGRPAPAAPDGELLDRFVGTRDEAAFAELVRRYGPLVFAVCRRITGNHHLSEDAFQAVFVVLAAKAGSVCPVSALPAWLHGVATRTALRARTVADRRRRREPLVEALPETAAPGSAPAETSDLAAVVDEEIAKLPNALRLAVVLCELDGHSRKDAAARLGVPEGTVSSRLAAARKSLAAALRARGVAVSAAGLSAVFAAHAAAGVPAALAADALAAATDPTALSATVANLSKGVLRVMFAQKLKTALPLAVLVLGGLACVAMAASHDPPVAQQPAPAPVLVRLEQPAPKPAPKPLPKGPNKLLYWSEGKVVLADPDGKNPKSLALKDNNFHAGGARLSPDGKLIAFLLPPKLKPSDEPMQAQRALPKLHVRALDEDGNGADLGVQCETFVWSPDGTEIAGTTVGDKPGKQPEMSSFIVNVKSKEKTTLKLPNNHAVTDWAPDGRLVTTSVTGTEWANIKARLHLMNRDGTEHKALAPDTNALIGRVSPDGTRVLCVLVTFQEETPAEKKKREEAGGRGPEPIRELAVLDIAAGKFVKVQDVPLNAELQEGYCWSPDGKRIAYTWRQKHDGKPEEVGNKETESHLIVCDPDGKNAKTVVSTTGKGQWHITLAGVDWR